MSDKDPALEAALAQIDRAFGKTPEGGPERVSMRVWLDPFTEERVRLWIRDRVNEYLPDDFDDAERMWEYIFDDMAAGEHRVFDFHPFDRMYPPVTIVERVGLFFRRLFGRWQRTETQIADADVKRACRRVERARKKAGSPRPAAQTTYSPEDPPF